MGKAGIPPLGRLQDILKWIKFLNLIVLAHLYPKKCNMGSGTFIKEQVRALKQITKGHITIISPVPWSPKILWFRKKWKEYGQVERKDQIDGIKIYYPRYIVIPGRWFFAFQGLFMYLSVRPLLKRMINHDVNGSVLHTHTILPDGFVGVLLGRKYKIPHICTIHGSDILIYPHANKFTMLLTRYALKGCDSVVTVGKALREKALDISGDINEKVSTIHNGANPHIFMPYPKSFAKEKLGISGGSKNILFIGRLERIKGVNNLLKAFAKLIKADIVPDVNLYLIGGGSERKNMEQIAQDLGIDNNVIFLGKRPHHEIPLWLSSADIFVLPSLSEGFPTVIPEAMMCGVPIVATDVGGVSEAIRDKITGLLVKPMDVDSLFKAICTYLADEKLTQSVIVNAIKLSEKYTWQNNAEQYHRLYNRLITC